MRGVVWERIVPGFCGISLVVVLVLSWSIGEFGSLRHAWLFASGLRLIIDDPEVRLADGKPGESRDAAFLAHNLSDHPIRIFGVTTSCSCVATDNLPATVPPKGIKELRLTLHLGQAASGTVNQTAVYHTDDPTAPSLGVKVSCRVVNP